MIKYYQENRALLRKRWPDRRFVSNIGYVGIANIIYAISQWGILILITKLTSIENVARFSLGLAVVSPIMLFFGSGLRVFISTDVQHKYTFGSYFTTRLITSSIGLFLISCFGLINKYQPVTLAVLLLIGVTKAIESFQEVCWGIDQRAEVMKPVGVSRILRSLTSILSIGLGLLYSNSLVGGVSVWALTWLVILLFYDLPQSKRLEKLAIHFEPKAIKKIIITIVPLAFITGLLALNEKVPQYQITSYLGEKALGYFAPLAYIVQGIALTVNSITETATPRLAANFHSDTRLFKKNTLLLVGVSTSIGIITLVVFGSTRLTLLPLLYTKEFLDYQSLFVMLLWVGILRFSLAGFGVSVTAAGKLKQQVPILICTLLITSISGWFLIPRYNLEGAALSILCGMAFTLIAYLVLWIPQIKIKDAGSI